jgi:hypothetical protein
MLDLNGRIAYASTHFCDLVSTPVKNGAILAGVGRSQ